MQIHGTLLTFPTEIKWLIGAFLITLSIGFFSGITFVKDTTNTTPKGVQERYLGNEEDENATKMMFKKTSAEIKTLVHNHILSLSVIFFLLAILVSTTSTQKKLKLFLMIEPFLSILLTFGGIYLLWKEILWMKYIIMLSGILMTSCFTLSVILIFRELIFSKKTFK